MTEIDVRHNEAEHRFEAEVEGGLAEAAYVLKSGAVAFVHTEVPKASRNEGVGEAIVRAGLEWARLRVIPSCPFVAAFVERHPEYAALTER